MIPSTQLVQGLRCTTGLLSSPPPGSSWYYQVLIIIICVWPLNSLPTIIPPLCAHHSSVYLICRWGWPGTRRWLPSAGLRAATVPDPVAWAGKWGRSIPVRGIHSHALGATELRPLLRARTGRRARMSNRRRPLTSTPADLSSFDVAPFSQHTIRIYRTAALVWSPTHTHTQYARFTLFPRDLYLFVSGWQD